MDKITPLGRQVLVELKAVEEKTKGGIILAATSKEEAQYAMAEGMIRNMGGDAFTPDGYNSYPVKATEGHRVMFRSYAGVRIPVDGKHYRLMVDSDIKAILAADLEIGKD